MTKFNLGQNSISTEILTTEKGNKIYLDKYQFTFKEWTKSHSFDTYNGKTILELNNEPLFAELLVLRLLENKGFKGAWVDSFRNKFWQSLPQFSTPTLIDKNLQEIYDKIYEAKGGRKAGCFDVIVYNGNEFIFIELKRKGKDKIRLTQIDWLEAALKLDLDKQNFIIAEWDI